MSDLPINIVDSTKNSSKKTKKKDLIGQRFYRLIVIEECGRNATNNVKWKCLCDCGKEIITLGTYLLKGETKSCGCYSKDRITNLRKTHGLWRHPLFGVWQNIITRCYNENFKFYKDYGGRGVKMCEEWRSDFKAFYDWCIANGWEKGLEIDKDIKSKELGIEPLLYSPERCCFVTTKVNCRNRRNSHSITIDGETATISEWTEKYNLPRGLISQRIHKLGWTPKDAVLGK